MSSWVQRLANTRLAISHVLLCATIFLLLGCRSELPGPLECENMAMHLIGRNHQQLRGSPAARRLVGVLVQGCLTTPFSRDTVACVVQSKNLPRCMEELAHRFPERRGALQALLEAVSP